MTPTKDNTIIVGAIQESLAINKQIFTIKRRTIFHAVGRGLVSRRFAKQQFFFSAGCNHVSLRSTASLLTQTLPPPYRLLKNIVFGSRDDLH